MGTSNLPAPVQQTAGVAIAHGETASSSVAARAKAEVEARAIVALQRPRSVMQFRIGLLEACKRSRFAETARYSKPVGGSKVEGFSIRFAEECARHYGNLAIDGQVVYDDADRRIIKVTATDLENNNAYSLDVTVQKTVERRNPKPGDDVIRSRTNSGGQTVYILRADDDALLNKQAALISKARRQLILQHIPSDITEEAGEVVLETLRSEDERDPAAARKRLVDAFYQIGVGPEELAEFLGHPLERVTSAEIHFLRSIYTGMKEGEATWADVMAQKKGTATAEGKAQAAAPAKGSGTDKLKDKLGAGKKADEPKAAANIPPYIAGLLKREAAGETLPEADAEELRFWRLDNPTAGGAQ